MMIEMNTNAARRGHKETAMNKSLIAIASATIALATCATSSAEAGFFHHHGGFLGHVLLHSFHHCHRPQYIVRTPVERVYVSRPARQVVVTQDEAPAQQQQATAHNENSSIAVASADVAENEATDSVEKIIVKTDKTAKATAKPAKVAEADVETGSTTPKRLDCKQFFPAVGMTLSVPCE
jgi:hypothetical protein